MASLLVGSLDRACIVSFSMVRTATSSQLVQLTQSTGASEELVARTNTVSA